MTQAKVIISQTHIYVTGYSKNGATILFNERHGCNNIEHAHNTDVAVRAKAVAYGYQNDVIIKEDATEGQVLSGKFNNRF